MSPYLVPEGPYTIESIMESIRAQVIEPENPPSVARQSGEPRYEGTANPEAPRPLINDGTPVSALLTQIELMRQRQGTRPEYHIRSHRRYLGIITNFFKRFIFWGARPYMDLVRQNQETFNEAALNALRETSYQLDDMQRQYLLVTESFAQSEKRDRELLDKYQAIDQLEPHYWELRQLLSDLSARQEQHAVEHQTLVQEHWKKSDEISHELNALRGEIQTIKQRHDLSAAQTQASPLQRLDAMEITRGSFDDITQRQKIYLGLLKNVPGRVVDLGCGRGELLTMLRNEGIECWGAELDPVMVAAARAHGVHIETVDAITALASVPAASLGGIFAAQLVEHLFPGELLMLLRLARRQLAPGGVIILETINAGSPAAFAKSYTRDLDHKLPLHPEYLQLLLQQAGFSEVELHFNMPFAPEERIAPLPPADQLGLTPEAHAALQSRLDFLDRFLFGMQDFYVVGRQTEPTPATEPVGVPTVALHL
jgi:SAM-dependent methyltransferase